MQRTMTLHDLDKAHAVAERLAVSVAVKAALTPADAAKLLGVSLRTLFYKIRRYKLETSW